MSGANVQRWTVDNDDSIVQKATYPIWMDGIIISEIHLSKLYGAGLSIKTNNNGFQMIITNNIRAFRYWLGTSFYPWKVF